MEVNHGDTQDVSRQEHQPARPMKVVVADDGDTWLCDATVDETQDLKDQGCWRCGEVPFTRND
jgi:hypothetical protein